MPVSDLQMDVYEENSNICQYFPWVTRAFRWPAGNEFAHGFPGEFC
jgi:hypothetical protein